MTPPPTMGHFDRRQIDVREGVTYTHVYLVTVGERCPGASLLVAIEQVSPAIGAWLRRRWNMEKAEAQS